MSNDPGYKIIQAAPLNPEDVAKAKAEISENKLRAMLSLNVPLGYGKLGGGNECNSLLDLCLNLDSDEFLKNLLRVPYRDAKTHVEIVVFMKNPIQLQRYRAGHDLVFIYRAIEGALGPENGFFRIVEGSQRMSNEEATNANAIDIRLEPGQVIILDGELMIEYPQAGGGISLMKCIKKS